MTQNKNFKKDQYDVKNFDGLEIVQPESQSLESEESGEYENNNSIPDTSHSEFIPLFNNYKNVFHSVIENAHEGIIIIRENYVISYVNSKFCKLFQREPQQVIKKDFRDLLDKETTRIFTSRVESLKKGIDIPLNYTINYVRKDGTRLFLEVNSMVIKDESNEILIVAQFLDITEKKIFESQLISAKEEAENADKLKSEFLAQISHEIRTPISTLLSFASLIRGELENNISDDLKTGFEIMVRAGKRIIRTTDLILNMSEMQLGTYEPYRREIDLKDEILDTIIAEFEPMARGKNLDFHINNQSNCSKIYADEYTTTQIIKNLLDNALKFTSEGNIVINIYDEEYDKLILEVADTGVGISDKYLSKLFTTFSQEEQGYTRKYEGNGLGLALVKKYCELNDAKIEVKSEKHVGSIFRVIFSMQSKGEAE